MNIKLEFIEEYLNQNKNKEHIFFKISKNNHRNPTYKIEFFNSDVFNKAGGLHYAIRNTNDLVEKIVSSELYEGDFKLENIERTDIFLYFKFSDDKERKKFLDYTYSYYESIDKKIKGKTINYDNMYLHNIADLIFHNLNDKENMPYSIKISKFFKDLGTDKFLKILKEKDNEITSVMANYYGLKGLRASFTLFNNSNFEIKKDFYNTIKEHQLFITRKNKIMPEFTNMVFKLFNDNETQLQEIGFIEKPTEEFQIEAQSDFFKFNIKTKDFINLTVKNKSMITAKTFFDLIGNSFKTQTSNYIESFDYKFDNENINLTVSFSDKTIEKSEQIKKFKQNLSKILFLCLEKNIKDQDEFNKIFSTHILFNTVSEKIAEKNSEKNNNKSFKI